MLPPPGTSYIGDAYFADTFMHDSIWGWTRVPTGGLRRARGDHSCSAGRDKKGCLQNMAIFWNPFPATVRMLTQPPLLLLSTDHKERNI